MSDEELKGALSDPGHKGYNGELGKGFRHVNVCKACGWVEDGTPYACPECGVNGKERSAHWKSAAGNYLGNGFWEVKEAMADPFGEKVVSVGVLIFALTMFFGLGYWTHWIL